MTQVTESLFDILEKYSIIIRRLQKSGETRIWKGGVSFRDC